MKLAIAGAAFWIAFTFADHAMFGGRYVRLVTGFFVELCSAFCIPLRPELCSAMAEHDASAGAGTCRAPELEPNPIGIVAIAIVAGAASWIDGGERYFGVFPASLSILTSLSISRHVIHSV